MSRAGGRDAADPPSRGPPVELGAAIAASSHRVAVRHWQGVPVYVAWVKLPIKGRSTPRYRVARRTATSFEGWQVRNLVQVEYLLVQVWRLAPTNWGEVWADWTPVEQPLESIVGAITYQQ